MPALLYEPEGVRRYALTTSALKKRWVAVRIGTRVPSPRGMDDGLAQGSQQLPNAFPFILQASPAIPGKHDRRGCRCPTGRR